MPPSSSSRPFVFDSFGGEVSYPGNQQSVPVGKSPACQNVQFQAGRVSSRPGLTSVGTLTGRIATLKEWVSLDLLTRRLLAFTDAGTLYKESPVSSYGFVSVATEIVEAAVAATLRMNSVTAFGRECMAFSSNGKAAAYPLQFDDTNLDPIAPCGPGTAPAIAAAGAGSIQAGAHSARICYLTRTGFLTAPGPPGSFTFSGTTGAQVNNLPIGPSYVVARVIIFTPECSNDYFYLPNTFMVVADNTSTTSPIIDFVDGVLVSGVKVLVLDDPQTDRGGLIELPAQASLGMYGGRLVGTGERATFTRNRDVGLLNLSFRGGFFGNAPSGWTELVAGESSAAAINGVSGGALKITGDGVGQRGCIENNAFPKAQLPPGVDIYARVRAKKSAAATGSVFLYFSASGVPAATIAAGYQLNASALSSSEWRVLEGVVLLASANNLSPTSTFRVTGGAGADKLNNGEWIALTIELFQVNQGVAPSRARISRAQAIEEFDGLRGFCLVNQNDGQGLVGPGFQIGAYYYFTKDRSLYAVRDDGFSDPVDWPVNRISQTVGALSAKSVAVGDNWVAIASRAGLYLFNGSSLQKISQQMQPTWDRINMQYRHTVEVKVDVEQRRILVAVPLDGATTPTTTLTFEWDATPTDNDFNRWFIADGAGILTMEWTERANGTRVLVMGTDHATGKILLLDDAAHQDYGLAIDNRYRFAFVGGVGGRRLFDYWIGNVQGAGSFSVTPISPDASTSTQGGGGGQTAAPAFQTLEAAPNKDLEYTLDTTAERMAVEVQTNAVDAWFGMQKAALFAQDAPYNPTRGR